MTATFVHKVEYHPPSALRPAKTNPRTHSAKQLRQLKASVSQFGLMTPLLISDDFAIIAGHGRHTVATELGLAEIPCIKISHLTADERRAYLIADNALCEAGGWDKTSLSFELKSLSELNFDLDALGFETPEVDIAIGEAEASSPAGRDSNDEVPAVPAPSEVVCREGDQWVLGRHTLIIGDAKDPACLSQLMATDKAAMIFCDPPYNVGIVGNVSGLGHTKHREFVEASGEMSEPQFVSFLTVTLGNSAAHCKDGAIAYTFMDWRHAGEILEAGAQVFSEQKNLCIWAKTNGGMGTFYRSRHELVFVWKIGTAPHTNNFGLGEKGRYRTNVWSYAGANTFRTGRMDDLASHPTVKPVALIADAIRDVSHRGEIVLDCFGGSGSTLIAAETTGRVARLLELDPAYGDVIIHRFEKLTGRLAVLATSSQTFEEVAFERAPKPVSKWGR